MLASGVGRLFVASVVRISRAPGTRLIGVGAQIPALMLLGLVLALTASSAASAAPTTQTFPFNGNSQFFTIPDGVTSVQITVQGGSGGMGYPTVGGGIGGAGAQITGTVAVTPGEPWEIDVGGAGGGGTAPGASCFFNESPSAGGSGGDNGADRLGGNGGTGDECGGGGGGGGGADTDIFNDTGQQGVPIVIAAAAAAEAVAVLAGSVASSVERAALQVIQAVP